MGDDVFLKNKQLTLSPAVDAAVVASIVHRSTNICQLKPYAVVGYCFRQPAVVNILSLCRHW
jgi:hypothetical protein